MVTGSAMAKGTEVAGLGGAAAAPGAGPKPGPDLGKVAPRKNLNETAFFFPHLLSDTNGTVRLQFTLPEALTEWRFLGFAHDRKLRAGLLEGRTVTARDLMVQPNPPRSARGDVIESVVKGPNEGDQPRRGQVRLTFNDALTKTAADGLLGNRSPEQDFAIPPRESRTFAWRIAVPDGLSLLAYKAVGAADTLADGEEGLVPVLSRRVLVTNPCRCRSAGRRRRSSGSNRSRTRGSRKP